MLCSNCSTPIKPVVAVDIDGTLADYHGHFLRFAKQWLGRDDTLRNYDGATRFRDWFCSEWNVDVTTFRMIKLAYRQGGMKRTQPPLGNPQMFVQRLRDRGAEVWLTTNRPHDRFDRVDPDTREWLSRMGIEFDGLLYHDNKMAELAERVTPRRVVAVLDDQDDILYDAGARDWFPILRRTHYNRNVSWTGARAESLRDAYEIIKTRIEAWERNNG